MNNIIEQQGDVPNSGSQQAWVVFSGQADLPWLRFFKPGFRHCYVLMNDGSHWITLDPLSSHMDVQVHHVPQDFDMPRWLKSRGLCVMRADLSRVEKPAPWMAFTCVEAVKRVLGLHKRLIFTPWQLYRHLIKIKQQSLTMKEKGDFAWEV